MNFILFGFKGCGKTYFGKLLSKKLKLPFIDTDHLIEKLYYERYKEALTCRKIYQKKGKEFFLKLENEVISTLIEVKNSIISIGGGAILQKENATILKQIGTLFYLKASKETLKKRMISGKIAAYIDANNLEQSFEKMYALRKPEYEKISAISVDTEGKTDEEILRDLIKGNK